MRNVDGVTIAVIDGEWEGTNDGIDEWITLDKVDGTKDGELDGSSDGEEGVLNGSKDGNQENNN